jgi:hypothetical protein
LPLMYIYCRYKLTDVKLVTLLISQFKSHK